MSPQPPEWDREKVARELDTLRWRIADALADFEQDTEGMEDHPFIRSATGQTRGIRDQIADYARLTRQGVQGAVTS